MKRRDILLMSAVTGVAAFISMPALAQAYPSKPIRLIVPFPPGGTNDVLARIIAPTLSQHLGQQVVVDNKGGAAGAIGALEMIRSPADGYTLLVASSSVTGAGPAINPNAGYNPVTDVTAIGSLGTSPNLLTVHPSFPARNYKDFIAEVKRKPGRYTYGTPGLGSFDHLQIEIFKAAAGISLVHIPFRGAGPAQIAALAGQVDVMRDTLASVHVHAKSGRLVPVAINGDKRSRDFPDVPTFKEVGIEQPLVRFGVLGPRDMPRDLVARINGALRATLEDPAVRKRIEDTGSEVIIDAPEDYAADIKLVFEQFKKVVAERKLTME
jgi:tripartite-type tricarboxylate transporter receptor subunit TctC